MRRQMGGELTGILESLFTSIMAAPMAVWPQVGVLLVVPKGFRTCVVFDTACEAAHERTRVSRVRDRVCCKTRSQVEGLGAPLNVVHESEWTCMRFFVLAKGIFSCEVLSTVREFGKEPRLVVRMYSLHVYLDVLFLLEVSVADLIDVGLPQVSLLIEMRAVFIDVNLKVAVAALDRYNGGS